MTTDEQPSAFPRAALALNDADEIVEINVEGMTLRDWFAGQALAGCLANTHPVKSGNVGRNDYAFAAYAYADAMLAEREKTP